MMGQKCRNVLEHTNKKTVENHLFSSQFLKCWSSDHKLKEEVSFFFSIFFYSESPLVHEYYMMHGCEVVSDQSGSSSQLKLAVSQLKTFP